MADPVDTIKQQRLKSWQDALDLAARTAQERRSAEERTPEELLAILEGRPAPTKETPAGPQGP